MDRHSFLLKNDICLPYVYDENTVTFSACTLLPLIRINVHNSIICHKSELVNCNKDVTF